MPNQSLVEALRPITSRMRRDVCWIVKKGPPSRIDRPLDDDAMAHHVNGGPAYGAVPIKPGESVTMLAVLDLDSHKGEVSWAEMQDTAVRVITALEQHGLKPIPFRSSGGNGMHIYVLWADAQDAYSVRTLLANALSAAGFSNGTGGVAKKEIEIFPKQNMVGEKSFGNMFVLPLANKSVPLDPFELADMPKDWVCSMPWPMSKDVMVVTKPEVVKHYPVATGEGCAELQSALDAIPNSGEQELEYDQWFKVICGIHHATDGAGLALAHEFSARSSKYAPEFLDERVWPYVKYDHDSEHGAITVGTVYKIARTHGWIEPVDGMFEVVEAPKRRVDDGKAGGDPPDFKRDKHGAIKATLPNVLMALQRVDVCKVSLRYDMFRDELIMARGEEIRPFTDTDYTDLRVYFEDEGFDPIGKEMMRDAVLSVGAANKYDSAIDWLNSLKWDGTPRIDRFLADYFDVKQTTYHKAVSAYLWTALAARVLDPGCQTDMVPVLYGSQGVRKSTAVAAIPPLRDMFTEVDLGARDADQSRKMRGKLIGEIGELKGLHSRDAESVKAFITRRYEEWVPKWREFGTLFPRRLVFVGTTNKDEFLSDSTGNRRWLPVNVGAKSDVEGIERDRDQLWAEAALMFAIGGVAWKDAEDLAKTVHATYSIDDNWADDIRDWINTEDTLTGEKPLTRKFLQVRDVMENALGLTTSQRTKSAEMRVCDILRAFKFVKKHTETGKVWIFPENLGHLTTV